MNYTLDTVPYKIKESIAKHSMLRSGDYVLVGLSGGADSMTLLYSLKELGYKVCAAHINHGLRGEFSDADEHFSAEVCASLNIELKILRTDITAESQRTSEGLEECGRRIRYDFFEKSANELGADKIATAHNSDDNSESIIMNLCRGTGLNGLCGISPVWGRVIRPLLSCSRKEIEEYCEKNQIRYCIDDTNYDIKYTRNFIRHEIIPRLMEINQSLSVSFERMTDSLRTDEDFLQKVAAENTDCDLRMLHPAIQTRIISNMYSRYSDSRALQKIHYDLLLSGKRIVLPGGLSSEIIDGKIFFDDTLKQHKNNNINGIYLLFEGENYIKDLNLTIHLKLSQKFNIFFNNNLKICDIILRSRREGDTFAPAKRKRKSLKKFFIDEKIPAEKRSSIPVIACGNRVLWVEGYGIDKDFINDAAVSYEYGKIQRD